MNKKTASLVYGILSLCFNLISWIILGIVFSSAGLAMGILALVNSLKAKKESNTNMGIANAGLITGIIGIVLNSVALIITIFYLILTVISAAAA